MPVYAVFDALPAPGGLRRRCLDLDTAGRTREAGANTRRLAGLEAALGAKRRRMIIESREASRRDGVGGR